MPFSLLSFQLIAGDSVVKMDSINEYLVDNLLCISFGMIIGGLGFAALSWVKDNFLS